MPPQPKPESGIASKPTSLRITERDRRPESPVQPATPSPALVEKTVTARIPVVEARIQRPVVPELQAPAVPLAAVKAMPAPRKPAALIEQPRPAPILDRPEISGPRASIVAQMVSFLSPAPSRKEGVSPAEQHLPGIVERLSGIDPKRKLIELQF
jgi:hypothetical protein